MPTKRKQRSTKKPTRIPRVIDYPLLCVDPGIRNTGWCYWKSAKAGPEHGVIEYKNGATGWERIEAFLVRFAGVLIRTRPATVAFEDYHWMGARRGYALMLKLVGALGGMAWSITGGDILWVRPKAKGKKRKPRPGWLQHDTDAYHLKGAL